MPGWNGGKARYRLMRQGEVTKEQNNRLFAFSYLCIHRPNALRHKIFQLLVLGSLFSLLRSLIDWILSPTAVAAGMITHFICMLNVHSPQLGLYSWTTNTVYAVTQTVPFLVNMSK